MYGKESDVPTSGELGLEKGVDLRGLGTLSEDALDVCGLDLGVGGPTSALAPASRGKLFLLLKAFHAESIYRQRYQ